MQTDSSIDFNPTTQGKVHPEQGERECFLGNFDPPFIEKLKKNWATLRIGAIAYDESGTPYPETILPAYRPLPVFADRNETLMRHYELYTSRTVPVSEELLKKVGLKIEKK